eukprot:374832-Pyramimonas_sp.AAC.1
MEEDVQSVLQEGSKVVQILSSKFEPLDLEGDGRVSRPPRPPRSNQAVPHMIWCTVGKSSATKYRIAIISIERFRSSGTRRIDI